MKFRHNFLLLTLILTPCTSSEQNDKWDISVVSTTPLPPTPSDNDEIRKSLNETNNRLEKFELQLNQVQKNLEKLLQLHGVKPSDSTTDDQDEVKVYNPCESVTTNINQKLEEMKEDIKSDIDKRHKEQTEFIIKSLEQGELLIMVNLSSELSTARKVLDAIETKLVSTNNQLDIVNTESYANCKDILDKTNGTSGIYTIKPSGGSGFNVSCDMDTKGGGWTSFMRRFDGSQDFYLNWTDYKNGFGNLNGEFWLGLEHLHQLTASTPQELLLVFTDWEGKTAYSNFKKFRIGNEKEHYMINTLQGHSGAGGQSFVNHLHKQFSTLDRQNAFGGCVKTYHGPWWYGPGCFHVKLTGKYLKGNIQTYADGIHASEFHGYKYSLKEVKMMVRPST